MKTMDSTANEDIIAGLTKSPEGGYTGKYSPAADMTGYLLSLIHILIFLKKPCLIISMIFVK